MKSENLHLEVWDLPFFHNTWKMFHTNFAKNKNH